MQTVGERLRDERERKGLTLKDIENETNIRSLYLQAIEEGNYRVLPGEAYVKGFIRNYANALGLNGAEYVEFYRKDQQPTPTSLTTEGADAVQEAQEPPAAAKSVSTRRRQRSRRTEIIWMGIFLCVLVIGGGFWWYWYSMGDDFTPQAPLEAPPQVQQQSSSTELNPKPIQVTPVSPAVPAAKPVVIEAKFISRSWVQVIVDGKQIYEGIPETGKSMTWQAEQQMTLKAGNAGGVELSYNGQSLGKLGGNGEVIVKTFTNTVN